VSRRLAPTGFLLLALLLPSCAAFKRCAYEGFGRDGWQQPERVVETLALSPGDRVADLGAGGGFFTFRLAQAVGPDGVVYAVDVDESMTDHLTSRAAGLGHANVQAVLAPYDDPNLPDGSIDLLFTCNTYHHFEDRVAYFERVRADLAPGGRVAIVDFDGPGFLRSHYSEKADIEREMEQAGYRLVADHDFLDRQSFLVFAPD
jgi:ubiquinone/menaquinone biosynthesis C-methylase UbiE